MKVSQLVSKAVENSLSKMQRFWAIWQKLSATLRESKLTDLVLNSKLFKSLKVDSDLLLPSPMVIKQRGMVWWVCPISPQLHQLAPLQRFLHRRLGRRRIVWEPTGP